MTDWDDAYSNGAHIRNGESYPAKWAAAAAAFRAQSGNAELDLAYGAAPRERFDLFHPDDPAKGVLIFVHGGYWMAFDKSFWSHLASGGLARGWAVAMPSYTLCPDIRVKDITRQIGQAVTAIAELVAGPIRLAGHSAGGHLVSRLNCADSPMPDTVRARLRKTVSISGLHDLRPLQRTSMNQTLCLDDREAELESPALLRPLPGTHLCCWVGSEERPEFRRQNALLANIWGGLGASMGEEQAPGRHHFDVIDALADPKSALIAELASP